MVALFGQSLNHVQIIASMWDGFVAGVKLASCWTVWSRPACVNPKRDIHQGWEIVSHGFQQHFRSAKFHAEL